MQTVGRVIIEILSKCPTDAAARILQQLDVKNPCTLQFRWEFLARNVKCSVRVFIQLLTRYFTDVKFINPILEYHEKEGLIVWIAPSTTTSLDGLRTVAANSVSDDMAAVKIDTLKVTNVR
jgi:hypothetical protein